MLGRPYHRHARYRRIYDDGQCGDVFISKAYGRAGHPTFELRALRVVNLEPAAIAVAPGNLDVLAGWQRRDLGEIRARAFAYGRSGDRLGEETTATDI